MAASKRHPAEARTPKKDTATYFHDKDGNVIDSSHAAKQSFKDQCDINKILKKAQVTGTLSHIAKYDQKYGDYGDFNYEDAMNKIAEANTMFYELPSEVRAGEFHNKPAKFLDFVKTHTPEQIKEKLPMLAAPGHQFPDVVGGPQVAAEPGPGASPSPASSESAPAGAEPVPDPAP